MAEYYKPWLVARKSCPTTPAHPLDKIRCRNGHRRYVVACMHNCPRPRYCREFWQFFETQGIAPTDYYNEDGIGELAMRRIVFDCDRCGKKDLEEVFSMYSAEGEGPDAALSEEQRRTMVESCGFAWDGLGPFVFHTLERLERDLGWVHYCRRCFQQSTEFMGKICQVKPIPALKKAGARAASRKKSSEDAKPSALRVAKTPAAGEKTPPAPKRLAATG